MTSAQSCSWNQPGRNPYTGRQGDAIWRLSNVPAYTREKLIDSVAWTLPTDRVWITRDRIWGKREYAGLRDMHFGSGLVCRWPQYSGWDKNHMEAASVWCESGTCVIIPDVCGNVAQVTKVGNHAVPPPASPALRSLPEWIQGLFPNAPRLAPPPGWTRPESEIPSTKPEDPVNTVPEPGTVGLVVIAIVAACVLRFRPRTPL